MKSKSSNQTTYKIKFTTTIEIHYFNMAYKDFEPFLENGK